MTAQGKLVTANLTAGDRIIVTWHPRNRDCLYVSTRKTGPDAHRATVQSITPELSRSRGRKAQRTYRIVTDLGTVPASAPAQTYWTWN